MAEITGPTGIGKTRLAAEFTGRFGWRFADGVAWVKAHGQTTLDDVIGQVAPVLDMPANAQPDDVASILGRQRVLVVIDQVDAITSRAELERLGAWLRAISPESPSVVQADSAPVEPDPSGRGARMRWSIVTQTGAHVALRLAVERGVMRWT